MKRFYSIAFFTLIVLVGLGWMFRIELRDALTQWQKPSLPPAETFQAAVSPSPTQQLAVVSSAPTSIKRAPEVVIEATSTDPLVWNKPLPARLNLAVPFLSQAPTNQWVLPYEEACEEAAAIMGDAYLKGRTMAFQPDEGDKAILALIDFEKKLLGKYEDTNAEETAQFIRAYFHDRVLVRDLTRPEDIQHVLANGYPVIIPAYGRALNNPHFSGAGPLYHMVVVKGYLSDGQWITNDPGTRVGENYLYPRDVLMNAAHDWNGGDVVNGKPKMIVILPNQ